MSGYGVGSGALDGLSRFASGYAEKAPFNIADIATGLSGAVAERTSNSRVAAKAMDPAG
jgi:hypothetical protein